MDILYMQNDFVSRKDVELAFIEKGQSSKRYKWGEKWELDGDEIREALQTVPAADVRPVVRGHWIHDDDGWASCSVCGEEADSDKWEMDARGKNKLLPKLRGGYAR